MAETPIVIQEISRSGLEETYVAAAQDIYNNGMSFPNSGKEFIRIKQGVGARVLTIVNPTTVDGLPVADRAVTIPASKNYMIGPFPKSYNDADGLIHLTFDALTNTSIAVIRMS